MQDDKHRKGNTCADILVLSPRQKGPLAGYVSNATSMIVTELAPIPAPSSPTSVPEFSIVRCLAARRITGAGCLRMAVKFIMTNMAAEGY
jgi:hypothetical protein